MPNLNKGQKNHFIILDKINFDMSIVIGVVSFIGRVWTIWLVILIGHIFARIKIFFLVANR
jgi:UPF0716 family protein affecting phage T7 exclusion